MIYAFRIKQSDNTISHHGLVSAGNTTDLFWAIDEFVDPHAVELKKCKQPFSICFTSEEDEDEDEDEAVVPMQNNEIELGDHLYNTLSYSDGWYVPKWKNFNELIK